MPREGWAIWRGSCSHMLTRTQRIVTFYVSLAAELLDKRCRPCILGAIITARRPLSFAWRRPVFVYSPQFAARYGRRKPPGRSPSRGLLAIVRAVVGSRSQALFITFAVMTIAIMVRPIPVRASGDARGPKAVSLALDIAQGRQCLSSLWSEENLLGDT